MKLTLVHKSSILIATMYLLTALFWGGYLGLQSDNSLIIFLINDLPIWGVPILFLLNLYYLKKAHEKSVKVRVGLFLLSLPSLTIHAFILFIFVLFLGGAKIP